MKLLVEFEPEAALSHAERSGVLVVPYEAEFAQEEWCLAVERWEGACRAEGRASIACVIDRNPGRACIHFDGKGLPCFAEERLDSAMSRVLEEVVDGVGFPGGPFASWRTLLLPVAKAVRVAVKARRLDHLARDPLEAAAFEDGGKLGMVVRVHDL